MEIAVRYRFLFPDGQEERFDVRLDEATLEPLDAPAAAAPAWTALAFQQCPHCPLDPATTPLCPLAVRVAPVVDRFADVSSHQRVRTEVEMEGRVVSHDGDAQTGVSSLLGLLMATSGCPRMAYFKPMARFHTPFAQGEETLFRAVGMYLLAQHFIGRRGGRPDLELRHLTDIYRGLQVLNGAVANRMRAASARDTAVNAVVVLDYFAANFSLSMDEGLTELEPLFRPYLDVGDGEPPG